MSNMYEKMVIFKEYEESGFRVFIYFFFDIRSVAPFPEFFWPKKNRVQFSMAMGNVELMNE